MHFKARAMLTSTKIRLTMLALAPFAAACAQTFAQTLWASNTHVEAHRSFCAGAGLLEQAFPDRLNGRLGT